MSTIPSSFGYYIDWINKHYNLIEADHGYNIWHDYTQGPYYAMHDHSLGEKNTVPNKDFQIKLAKFIAEKYLKDVKTKLERFDG